MEIYFVKFMFLYDKENLNMKDYSSFLFHADFSVFIDSNDFDIMDGLSRIVNDRIYYLKGKDIIIHDVNITHFNKC